MTLMVDGVFLLVALELIVVAALKRVHLLPTVVAGAMLLLAMRLALSDAGLAPVGAALLAAGIAHAIDLRRHFSAPPAGGRGPG